MARVNVEMIDKMTRRQLQVLQLIANGLKPEEIATELGIKYSTVKTHYNHIFNKLAVHNQAHAVAEGMRKGWIS